MAKFLVQVCGDPTVDWLSVHDEDFIAGGGIHPYLSDRPAPGVRLSSQAGGSALILQLLREMISPEVARVEGSDLDARLLERPRDDQITSCWTTWRSYPEDQGGHSRFRLLEWGACEPGQWDYSGHKLGGEPDLLVIVDSGLGFDSAIAGWPDLLGERSGGVRPAQIMIKLTGYANRRENPLLARIQSLGLADRTTVLTAIEDLRACPVRIGVSLSWERLFEEIVAAVHSPGCPFADENHQLIFQRVIVTVGSSGAAVIGRDHHSLIFDRSGQEGDFAKHLRGQMMGGSACMLGALATAWIYRPGSLDWTTAVRDGIGLARLLHLEGYQVVAEDGARYLRFPYQGMGRAYRERPRLVRADSPDKIWDLGIYQDVNHLAGGRRSPMIPGYLPATRLGGGGPARWSILEEAVKAGGCNASAAGAKNSVARGSKSVDAVCACARQIVEAGPRAALPNAPVEMVGHWSSADRREIEGVRSVYNAVGDYMQQGGLQAPLCAAVFGPPGAGKSFVVKEIARGLGISGDAQLTFNLSQLASPRELPQAFHRIRDLRLRGRLPLVFWDEFDTPCEGFPLGWLRYFLAPMQDGEFTDQGRTHPLGGGIHIFAGATRHSFEEFCAGNSRPDLEAKKPDFISRLRAYIDVRGPNGNPNTIEDRMFTIRRAFLLHHCLEANAPFIKRDNRFLVEPGVLDAFLKVTSYHHGARSLETLVKMSSLSGKRRFELSSLPPDHILAMHVNAGEFNALTRLGHREMLRVGITGHIFLDPDRMAELETGVARAATFIEDQFPERYLTVFSPLAIGADRLVARILLRNGATRLIVVLPVPLDDYIKDFGATDEHRLDYGGAELRKEFRYWLEERAIETIAMPRMATRGDAYLRSGCYIVEHSDVMVAVWDGKKAQGQGGTGEIVELAKKFGKPICHIWAGNYKPDQSRRTDVGARYGRFRHLNFPGDPKGRWMGECPR